MSPNRAPRVPGFAYEGFLEYFLTICTFPRRPVFGDLAAGAWVRDQFVRAADLHQFAVTAYCVMPDHVHLLVEAMREDCRLVPFVSAWKQTTGFEWKRRTKQRLWQEGFYDHVLRDDENAAAVVRYIVENPVRAGLVQAPEQYPLSGSSRYTYAQLADVVADWDPSHRRGRPPE